MREEGGRRGGEGGREGGTDGVLSLILNITVVYWTDTVQISGVHRAPQSESGTVNSCNIIQQI